MIKGFTMDDERLKGNGGGNYPSDSLKSGFVVCFYRSNEKADKKPIKKPIKADRQHIYYLEQSQRKGSEMSPTK
jgi:hypothetical protein